MYILSYEPIEKGIHISEESLKCLNKVIQSVRDRYTSFLKPVLNNSFEAMYDPFGSIKKYIYEGNVTYEYKPYGEWQPQDTVVFEGTLISYPRTNHLRGKMSVSRFSVENDDDVFDITIYNRPWIKMIKVGTKLTIIGKYVQQNKVIATNYIFFRCDSSGFSSVRICNLVARYHFGKFGFHLV